MTYLDVASTAPLHPAARAVLLAAYDDGWADPARLYGAARRTRLLLDDARARVAVLLAARPDEVTFTSSGTTSVQLAIAGVMAARARVGRGLVTTQVEHSCVLDAAAPYDTTLVAVDGLGRLDVDALRAAVGPATALVSVQHANHEVGTVQPIAEVVDLGVPLHVDAAQTLGRLDIPPYDLLSGSAHKWGGPPGVGVLVVRKGVRFRGVAGVDGRERGRAPGYENVPGVLAAVAALEAVVAEDSGGRLPALVDRIRTEVARRIPDAVVLGDPVRRLPHLVTFSCLYADGEALVTELDKRGFAVSSGSSCTSAARSPSHVLEAMGVLTHGNVRVSLGRDTTAEDVERFLDAVVEVVDLVRP